MKNTTVRVEVTVEGYTTSATLDRSDNSVTLCDDDRRALGILAAVRRAGVEPGHRARAARWLGWSERHLLREIARLGIWCEVRAVDHEVGREVPDPPPLRARSV